MPLHFQKQLLVKDPLPGHSCFLLFFFRAKSCLKLPPLSSYRMLTGFWFRLAENDLQHSKREMQSLKCVSVNAGFCSDISSHTSNGRDAQKHQHIVYQTFSRSGCCSFTKNKDADHSSLNTFKLMEVLVKVHFSFECSSYFPSPREKVVKNVVVLLSNIFVPVIRKGIHSDNCNPSRCV